MGKFINIGFGNVVNEERVIGIIRPDAAPVKRLVQGSKDSGMAIDATCGRKTKSVLVTDSGHVVLSALLPETIAGRAGQDRPISGRLPGDARTEAIAGRAGQDGSISGRVAGDARAEAIAGRAGQGKGGER